MVQEEMMEHARLVVELREETVVLVLEGAEGAAEDALNVLHVARAALKVAEEQVAKAQVDSVQASERARWVKIEIDRAIAEAKGEDHADPQGQGRVEVGVEGQGVPHAGGG